MTLTHTQTPMIPEKRRSEYATARALTGFLAALIGIIIVFAVVKFAWSLVS